MQQNRDAAHNDNLTPPPEQTRGPITINASASPPYMESEQGI